jgi:hypothetical protein
VIDFTQSFANPYGSDMCEAVIEQREAYGMRVLISRHTQDRHAEERTAGGRLRQLPPIRRPRPALLVRRGMAATSRAQFAPPAGLLATSLRCLQRCPYVDGPRTSRCLRHAAGH